MDVGEFELIDEVTAGLEKGHDVVLGVGDDAAALHLSGDVVVSTDLLVENVHFKKQWSPPFLVGRKAVAVNVSDVESMGARPSSVVVALAFPADLDHAWVKAFSDGVRDECARAGVSLVGGDMSSASQTVVCVTALGDLGGRRPVTRAGAKVGDVVAVAGRLGWASAGLTVLQRGFGSPKELVAEQQCPTVPYGQGCLAAEAGATSMMDVSDGLLGDLAHVCRASGVRIDLDTAAFDLPDPIQRLCAATGRSPWSFILAGGEDHALVATFPADATVPQDWSRVGRVVEGDGVTVDGEAWEGSQGWDHFT